MNVWYKKHKARLYVVLYASDVTKLMQIHRNLSLFSMVLLFAYQKREHGKCFSCLPTNVSNTEHETNENVSIGKHFAHKLMFHFPVCCWRTFYCFFYFSE